MKFKVGDIVVLATPDRCYGSTRPMSDIFRARYPGKTKYVVTSINAMFVRIEGESHGWLEEHLEYYTESTHFDETLFTL